MNRSLFLIFTIVALTYVSTNVKCAKILSVLPMASYSHFISGFRIVKELADRGHEVTVISPYPQKTPIKNYKDISVVENIEAIDEQKKQLFDLNKGSFLTSIRLVQEMSALMTENVFKNENVQKLLKSDEKFDAVFMEYFMNDAHMGLANHYNAPLILLTALPASFWSNHLVGNPDSSAYIPSLTTDFTSEMTFWQRVQNTIVNMLDGTLRELYAIPKQADILKNYLPHVPDLTEVMYNASILFVNSHESINDAVPHVPNMIPIGGYHVGPTKELPKDLKSFLDNAKEGVVLFSMGSNLQSKDLPVETRKGILKALSKIKQKVLWKFEEDLPGLPTNVKIKQWLPQQDILAHPNVVAFISHGGLLSTIEAVYFGVPIVGIPVFGDQMMNIARAANAGYGINIPLSQLSEETLSKALEEILGNPKYREEVKRRSAVMHDRQVKPIDTAVYWIEYAIRHKGAPHLKSAMLKLKWYQRELLDVYGFFAAVALTFIYLIRLLIKTVCCRSKSRQIVSKTKKNK